MYFCFIKDFFTAFTVINAYRFDCYSVRLACLLEGPACSSVRSACRLVFGAELELETLIFLGAMLVFAKRVG